MSAVETGQMTAVEKSVMSQYCPQLLLAEPDHEIQDFDQFLFEKLQDFCQSPFEPSTLRGVFEGDINYDCIFTRTLSCHRPPRIPLGPTAPTPDRQNPSAKTVWGMTVLRHCKTNKISNCSSTGPQTSLAPALRSVKFAPRHCHRSTNSAVKPVGGDLTVASLVQLTWCCLCWPGTMFVLGTERVWLQIVRNIWPTFVKISPKSSKINPNHEKPTC